MDLLGLYLTKIQNVGEDDRERYGNVVDIQLIRTAPGIGQVTAAVIKAEIGDATRFSSREKMVAYVRVSPMTCQSGEASTVS